MYVIIKVREGHPRDFVRDRCGGPLKFERRRTAEVYVEDILDKSVASYRVYKTDNLPAYMKEAAA